MRSDLLATTQEVPAGESQHPRLCRRDNSSNALNISLNQTAAAEVNLLPLQVEKDEKTKSDPIKPATAQPQTLDARVSRALAQWQAIPKNQSPFDPHAFYPLLPPKAPQAPRMTLAIDIDETLVHASTSGTHGCDCVIYVNCQQHVGNIFVDFRPHLLEFLNAIAPLFEVVVFTASQACYADQLMDAIDPQRKLGGIRLFREHCTEVNGARVKDLSLLGAAAGANGNRRQFPCCVPVPTSQRPFPSRRGSTTPRDTELLKLIPMLRQLAVAQDVYDVLDPFNASTGSASRCGSFVREST